MICNLSFDLFLILSLRTDTDYRNPVIWAPDQNNLEVILSFLGILGLCKIADVAVREQHQ